MKRSAFAPRSVPMHRGTSTLATTKPMNRGTTPMKRSDKPMAPVGARAKRMRQGKIPPNAQESAWMDSVCQFGCIVCWLQYQRRVRGEVHHLKVGDRRMGHLYSICLCKEHHTGGAKDGLYISRHPWRARFEKAYGSEFELLEQMQTVVKIQRNILPAINNSHDTLCLKSIVVKGK